MSTTAQTPVAIPEPVLELIACADAVANLLTSRQDWTVWDIATRLRGIEHVLGDYVIGAIEAVWGMAPDDDLEHLAWPGWSEIQKRQAAFIDEYLQESMAGVLHAREELAELLARATEAGLRDAEAREETS